LGTIITEPGNYGNREYFGIDPSLQQDDVALRIRVPHDQDIRFNDLKIRDCGLPLRHDSGNLQIGLLDAARFTADLFNSGGHLDIHTLKVVFDWSEYEYSDAYHVDALGQFFNHVTNVCRYVRIHNIDATIIGPKVQGFACTEPHQYIDFKVGTGTVKIRMEYKYGFFANNLEDSYINVGTNGVKILKRKPCHCRTDNVKIENHRGQLIVLDPGSLEFGSVSMTNRSDRTKVAFSAGHDRYHMKGASRFGINENDFWNEFLDDLMPLAEKIRGVEVKRFHRPNQRPIGYNTAMDRLHADIDRWGADIDVDLHFNASNSPAKGHEVLHFNRSKGGRIVAGLFDSAFDEYLQNRDRNRKEVARGENASHGLRVGKSKSVITEPFFSKELRRFVRDGDQRQNLIDAYLMFLRNVASVNTQVPMVTQKRNYQLSDDEFAAAMALMG